MLDNGITIHHKGESYPIELTEREADRFSDLTTVLEYAPRAQDRERTPQEVKAMSDRRQNKLQSAEDFQVVLKRLASLDSGQMAILMGILELIEFGEGTLSGGNWALAFVRGLASNVLYQGPAAVIERDPRRVLADLSTDLYTYWNWMRDGMELKQRHPSLFPAAPAVPEAAAKQRRARKARRKAA